MELFSLHVLFFQYRSCDNTLENYFFQISSYSRSYNYLRINYEKTSTAKTEHTWLRGLLLQDRFDRG